MHFDLWCTNGAEVGQLKLSFNFRIGSSQSSLPSFLRKKAALTSLLRHGGLPLSKGKSYRRNKHKRLYFNHNGACRYNFPCNFVRLQIKVCFNLLARYSSKSSPNAVKAAIAKPNKREGENNLFRVMSMMASATRE